MKDKKKQRRKVLVAGICIFVGLFAYGCSDQQSVDPLKAIILTPPRNQEIKKGEMDHGTWVIERDGKEKKIITHGCRDLLSNKITIFQEVPEFFW